MNVQSPDVRLVFVQQDRGGVCVTKRHLTPPRPPSRSIGATQKYFGKKHGEVNGQDNGNQAAEGWQGR